jgi:hypothetical protein
MEHQLWKAIVRLLGKIGKAGAKARRRFSDHDIVATFYWAVLHDRPVSWACQRRHWPIHLRKRLLPSSTTMSRRLQSPAVLSLLGEMDHRVVRPTTPGVFWMIDGKPLNIGGCSKDRQAGHGRSAGCKATGYKIHAIVNAQNEIADWRLTPMNKDERVMAERMFKTTSVQGYIIADSNYDSNKLHDICAGRGDMQLVTRRRYGPGKGLGHRRQTEGRLRSIAMTESPFPKFAERLLNDRDSIERTFGNLTNWGGGLTSLPPWVRTYRRVHRWVQAKLVLTALRRRLPITTYAE